MNCSIKHPFFSILIPVFNGEQLIAQCIESALSQTFSNFELLICNDASTDNTLEILEQYAEKDKRIRILRHETNQRALIARNDLIRAAKGKYCIFADADDILSTDFLEYAEKILKRKHYDIIRFLNCGKPVRYDKHRADVHHFVKRVLN